MRVTSTKDENTTRAVFILYGPSGAGKTYQARTVKSPIILSYESGLGSLKDLDIATIDMTKDDEGKPLGPQERIKKIEAVYAWLIRPEQQKKYDTVYVDSITEIGELIFQVEEAKFKNKALAEGKNYDLRQPYGPTFTELSRFVKAFRDMPHYDVVFSCLDSSGENEDTGIREIMLNLPGSKCKRQIPGLVDHVFYLDAKEDKDKKIQRMFLTEATAKVYAKNRAPQSIDLKKYEDADLGKLINKLKGEKK